MIEDKQKCRCYTCKWFDTNFTWIMVGGHGWCRRYPPKDEFPRVYENDWCGEYKEASSEYIKNRTKIKKLTDEKLQEITKDVMEMRPKGKPCGWYETILSKAGINLKK